jgi:hypothetical protein
MNPEVIEQMEDLMRCRKNFTNGEYSSISEDQFKSRMSERFSNLAENFPTIFEKTVSGFFENPEEYNRLQMAMSLIKRTQDGLVSKEDGEKQFGQHLVDKYVTPNLKDDNKSKNNKK